MNYFFNRIQIKIVHVSEIDSLLGNRSLDFLFAHVIEDIGLLGVGAFKGIVDLTKCECE